MKTFATNFIATIFFAVVLSGCAALRTIGLYKPTVEERIIEFKQDILSKKNLFEIPPQTKIDSVKIDSTRKSVGLYFSDHFSYVPYREKNVRDIYRQVEEYFDGYFGGFTISVRTLQTPIEQLIPNYYRHDSSAYDRTRMPVLNKQRPVPVVQNVSKPFVPTKGLFGRNIGLWHSHGWYYNSQLNRWEWQRPRLFLSVEDLIPTAFTLPYLIPMLEHAGANVFVPRERDTQTSEVIVDNDSPATGYEETSTQQAKWVNGSDVAFGIGKPPYGPGVNPFQQGTHRVTLSDTSATAQAAWVPDIPETGFYAVYISYAASDSNVSDARYTIRHRGGTTELKVNQQIGGRTWLYVGTFKFDAGKNRDSGSVTLTNVSIEPQKVISADAVRFGGGIGVVARNGQASGRPKYVEGARYFLQFAGMPDTLVFSLNGEKNDYRDDYQSRAEYLNYLTGAPFGPNKKRDERGLGIPIDLSLALHTDAGITNNDTTIGTLSIYSIQDGKNAVVFPDSMSRLANRDLADLIQTQVVNDVQAKYDPAWSRRQMRNADYSEAVRPNMPSVLLELLSHQNFLDMKFVLDPRFRFDVARAIYKGMLRFLAVQYGTPYVVQPLPVTHFAAELDERGGVLLLWKPQLDPIEPTATPDRYIVSTRINDGGFDNGRIVETTFAHVGNLTPGAIYSFKVAAVNDGGEGFASEILSVCWQPTASKPVLIINGFDRISGPGIVDAGEVQGFLSHLDRGAPDRFEIGFAGEQYDFNRSSSYRSNDGPGHGASFADNEGAIVAGNSFDYPFVHGESVKALGLSFSSASDEAVMDSIVHLSHYTFVDLILGKEKETHWPKAAGDSLHGTQFKAFPAQLQSALQRYCEAGGNLFVSGAYVGTDLFSNPKQDSMSIKFARNVLRFNWVTDHAARTGRVFSVDPSFYLKGQELTFNAETNPAIYVVESPDAIVPSEGSTQILRYTENQFGAGVAYKKEYGVVTLGFPFEAILNARKRTDLMRSVLKYLKIAPHQAASE